MSEGKRISLDVIVSDIIMFPQGFIQDFLKGGGELNDVHPLNLCSLMGIAIEGPNLIDIPIEGSLEKKLDAYPFNYNYCHLCSC